MFKTEQYLNNRHDYNQISDYNSSSEKVFDIIIRLANEGKINSDETNTLLSFYAVKLIEKKVENRINNLIYYDLYEFLLSKNLHRTI